MPSTKVELPGGEVVEFPEGVSEDDINSALSSYGQPAPQPPSLLDTLTESAQKGFQAVSPITSIPSRMSETAQQMLGALVPQSLKQAWQNRLIPNFFTEDPGEHPELGPSGRTGQLLAQETENQIPRGVLMPGLPPGTTLPQVPPSGPVTPPAAIPEPGTLEKALPYVAAPLAVG